MKGNHKSIHQMLGSSSHAKEKREINDFYITPKKATKLLLKKETFNKNIWEPACGKGHISKVLEKKGYKVFSSDLIDRNYGLGNKDFLQSHRKWKGDIITNPPYSLSQEFVQKSLDLISKGNKVAMFLKIQFLESKTRRKVFNENPPYRIYVSSTRIRCHKYKAKNKSKTGGAICYCWFVWKKGYKKAPRVKWFN